MLPLPAFRAPSRRHAVLVGALVSVAAVVAVALSARGTFSPRVLIPVVAAFMAGSAVLRAVRTRDRGAVLAGHAHSRIEQFGGGFYGTVALATWVYLEGLGLHALWAESSGPGDFVTTLSVNRLIGFGVDSTLNAVWAGMWPLHWVSEMGLAPTVAAAAVAAAVYGLALRVSGAARPAEV